jgi:hypothetical protein
MHIKFCISSNNNFSQQTFPVIIPSLLASGISPSDIYFIEGGHIYRSVSFTDGVNYIKTPNNSFDLTGLIDIVENSLQSDYWVLLHDTCRVGRDFYKLVKNIPHNCEKIALKRFPSMSIGAYKYSYLKKYEQKLLKAKNTNYDKDYLQQFKQWCIDNEDYMLWGEDNTACSIYNTHLHIPTNFVVVNESSWYKSNTQRRVEYYPQLDLYKSKSNWETKQRWEVDI